MFRLYFIYTCLCFKSVYVFSFLNSSKCFVCKQTVFIFCLLLFLSVFFFFSNFKMFFLSSDLLSRLRDARKPDGSTEHVGHILTDWVSECLS